MDGRKNANPWKMSPKILAHWSLKQMFVEIILMDMNGWFSERLKAFNRSSVAIGLEGVRVRREGRF